LHPTFRRAWGANLACSSFRVSSPLQQVEISVRSVDSCLSTISPTVYFFLIVLRIVNVKSFPRQPKCPEALGLHVFHQGHTSPSFHRKPQLRPLATSPIGVSELSATAALCITTQDTDRPTKPRNRQISQSSHIPPITISIWLQVCVLHMNPQTPGSTHYEEPTMTYVM